MAEATGVVAVHAPYEDALIAWARVIEKVIDGQSAEVKAELWKRFLEVTAPLHSASVAAAQDIEKLFKVS